MWMGSGLPEPPMATGLASGILMGSHRTLEQTVEERLREALARDRIIDITTTGRTSGQPRRIETWFYRVDDRFYLTGSPGRRDWYANLLAHPQFTFHLKQSVTADLPAQAAPITDPDERRVIFTRILNGLGGTRDLDAWLAGSPLMSIDFDSAGVTE